MGKKALQCEPGDGVIYKGMELKHGRDSFEGDFVSHVQVFLHYVDADGPYAEEYKYDKRPYVGIKKRRYFIMIPPIAVNTIIFTGALAVLGIVDFMRLINGYKKKRSQVR